MIKIARLLGGFLLAFAFSVVVITSFIVGYVKGYSAGRVVPGNVSSTTKPASTPRATLKPTPKPATTPKATSFGGPELWDAVNKSRVEHGVNPLKVKDELCTIASIRLNQLLDLGKLDGHQGFSNMPVSRPDLKWVFDKYTLSEFLVSGATSPQNAVDLWFNTLGHVKLLTGGEYTWGCIYAQNGFGVAIAAY